VAGLRARPLGTERRSGRLLESALGRGLAGRARQAPKLVLGVALGVPIAAFAALLVLALLLGGAAAASACAPTAEAEGSDEGPLNEKGIPSELVPIYQAAAAKYKLGPRGPAILAAINRIETAFGTNMGTSSAGAQGWMQFMPATWASMGVDADGDGAKNTRDPDDAIHAAARYLRASGAPGDWQRAIFAYNHAQWYVDDVLEGARGFGDPGGGGDGDLGAASADEEPAANPACTCASSEAPEGAAAGGEAKIIQGPYQGTHSLGNWQSDRAVDIGVPLGTPLVAVESGVIVKTGGQASLEGRFGGYSLTLAGGGNAFFYTHLKELKVEAGDRVRAGEVIGTSGKANAVEHLHLGVREGEPESFADRAIGAEGAQAPAPCPEGEAELGAASAAELLRSKNLILSNDLERRDLATGKIDPRIVAVLAMLVREHKVTVTALASDHDPGTNHEPGRAVDIGAIDGERCDGSRSGRCGQVAVQLGRIRGRYAITELIYCFDPGPGSGSFARADHCDHIHAGYDR
jgi:murein DD-endopeptidase MepM/ murein hydrolase activator NlpD